MKRRETPVAGLSVSKEFADDAMTESIRDFRFRAVVWLFAGAWSAVIYLVLAAAPERLAAVVGEGRTGLALDLAGLLLGGMTLAGFVMATIQAARATEAERLRAAFRKRVGPP